MCRVIVTVLLLSIILYSNCEWPTALQPTYRVHFNHVIVRFVWPQESDELFIRLRWRREKKIDMDQYLVTCKQRANESVTVNISVRCRIDVITFRLPFHNCLGHRDYLCHNKELAVVPQDVKDLPPCSSVTRESLRVTQCLPPDLNIEHPPRVSDSTPLYILLLCLAVLILFIITFIIVSHYRRRFSRSHVIGEEVDMELFRHVFR